MLLFTIEVVNHDYRQQIDSLTHSVPARNNNFGPRKNESRQVLDTIPVDKIFLY